MSVLHDFSGLYEWTFEKISQLNIDWIPADQLAGLILVGALLLLSVMTYYLNKLILFKILRRVVRKTPGRFDDMFVDRCFLRRLGIIIPLILVYKLIPYALPHHLGWVIFVQDAMQILLALFILLAGFALLDSFYQIYQKIDQERFKPVKGYLQIVKILAGFVAGIFILSVLINESPGYLLGGLGAMTAVLLLVFKDTILGFVASVQLSSNDMVKPDDWITIEKFKADGTVREITLTSIKVQNFDNTFVYVPTYALISDSFQNWRGMQLAEGRRLKRSVNIDLNSVHFISDNDLERFSKIRLLSHYISDKQREIELFNQELNDQSGVPINVRRQTNIGIYRAYLETYLRNHPAVNKDLTLMVRQLPPADNGVAIEVYAFLFEKEWEKYEAIVADIFDHILAATRFFDLDIFQSASGADIRSAVSGMKSRD